MIHLAQVQRNPTSSKMELHLLAHQKSEHIWGVSKSESLSLDEENSLSEGLLVLVECSENKEILSIQEAKDWVLGLVKKYLTNGAITPEFVEEEQARVEQWRQEITLQSQDLSRQRLEIETLREQLQDLEASLERDKEKLETHRQQIQEWQEDKASTRE
ncbi:MAG: hypothetical protein AB4426_05930 [Xenococcaceae cyanobacterium]